MSGLLTDTEIDHVALGLIDRSLPKSEWTHVAHFAAALWLLKRGGVRAMSEMPPLIRAYNEATGVANSDTSGYHDDYLGLLARGPLVASEPTRCAPARGSGRDARHSDRSIRLGVQVLDQVAAVFGDGTKIVGRA